MFGDLDLDYGETDFFINLQADVDERPFLSFQRMDQEHYTQSFAFDNFYTSDIDANEGQADLILTLYDFVVGEEDIGNEDCTIQALMMPQMRLIYLLNLSVSYATDPITQFTIKITQFSKITFDQHDPVTQL